MADPNLLFYGDNLDVLRQYIKDETVDLVYLDPPFNSNANYNVLFAEQDGSRAASQIKAFEDTWRWDSGAVHAYGEALAQGGKLHDTMMAFGSLVGRSNMLAYLSMMSIRLVELRRVMKPTASIYLHCDPTASHYLKVLMDAIFGAANFQSEIVWKRSSAHSDTKQGRKLHGHIHDVLLFYTKTDNWTWNPVFTPYDAEYTDAFYRYIEPKTGRRYRLSDITGPGGEAKGNPRYDVMGVTRYWRYSKSEMERLIKEGRVIQTKPGTVPAEKRYLDEMPGVPLQDLWTDLKPIGAQANERLGYPTQKPVALLERIVQTSSKAGDTVLDPFCGCGTTIDAAQRLGRRWIGIDITHIAINLIKSRLHDTYGEAIKATYRVVGEPADVESAAQLAADDPWQFQAWALSLVEARQATSAKRGGDEGIDGRLIFAEDDKGGFGSVILSVKAGNLVPAYVDQLIGVVESNKGQIGALISMNKPTQGMYQRAAKAGLYESAHWGKFPKIQLLTVEGLQSGKERLDYPRTAGSNLTFQRAKRAQPGDAGEQLTIETISEKAAPAPKHVSKVIKLSDL